MVTVKQRNRILELLQNGATVRHVHNIEHASKWAIYRIIDETGVRENRGYVKETVSKKTKKQGREVKPEVKCLGIGYCGTCKHFFQYPCLLGYDS